jgi:hypothetical protein
MYQHANNKLKGFQFFIEPLTVPIQLGCDSRGVTRLAVEARDPLMSLEYSSLAGDAIRFSLLARLALLLSVVSLNGKLQSDHCFARTLLKIKLARTACLAGSSRRERTQTYK